MFIVTPYFFLKLVQKLRKKSLHFSELLFDSSKTNSCQLSYLKQNFWLAPNVTNAQKRLLRYPQPCNLVPRVIFFLKKKTFCCLHLQRKDALGTMLLGSGHVTQKL